MFILNTWSTISKAIKTADRVNPTVVIEALGVYRVAGRNNTEFTVACYKDEEGKRVVDCGCVAGTKLHTPCFHAAAAIKAHVSMVTWSQPVF